MVHNEDNDNNNNDDNNGDQIFDNQSIQMSILIIIGLLLYLAYTVECYHCSTRFVLVSSFFSHLTFFLQKKTFPFSFMQTIKKSGHKSLFRPVQPTKRNRKNLLNNRAAKSFPHS